MKTIVVPTDFSGISLNAVDYAADLACVVGANLTLMHVCFVPLSFSEVPAPSYSMTELLSDAEEQLKTLKEKMIYRTRDRIRINTIVKQGDIVPQIDSYCATVNPYAVVMGAENTGKFERFLLGGKTVSAVKQLSWPLIVVPPGVKFFNIRKIGLACDFRNVVETIPVKEIENLVKEFHAELHVLHVSMESGDAFSAETVEESGWLQEILGDIKPKYHFIHETNVEKAIGEFAEKNKLDLLIVIPKKHYLFSKIFEHSHSRRLVLHAHVPVMAIHE